MGNTMIYPVASPEHNTQLFVDSFKHFRCCPALLCLGPLHMTDASEISASLLALL